MPDKPLITVVGLGGYSIFMNTEMFPDKGETVKAIDCFTEPGGKGYNQAVGCTRLGARTVFIGSFGNDIYGQKCIDFLEKESVDTSFIKIVKDKTTAVGVILTDANGDNRISVYSGAAEMLRPEDILAAEEIISRSNVLLIQLEVPFDTVICAIDTAAKHNVNVILNPAPALLLENNILKKVYLLTPNEFEAHVISGDKVGVNTGLNRLAEKIKALGTKNVIITLGENGAYLSSQDIETRIEPVKVSKVVDTTGAGDTFNAALAVCIAKDIDVLQAAKFATTASALSITEKGVMNSIPYLYDVVRFESSMFYAK